MKMKRACKKCQTIFEGSKCPNCDSQEFTEGWKGRVVILDPKGSEIAKKLKFDKKGSYAIKTR